MTGCISTIFIQYLSLTLDEFWYLLKPDSSPRVQELEFLSYISRAFTFWFCNSHRRSSFLNITIYDRSGIACKLAYQKCNVINYQICWQFISKIFCRYCNYSLNRNKAFSSFLFFTDFLGFVCLELCEPLSDGGANYIITLIVLNVSETLAIGGVGSRRVSLNGICIGILEKWRLEQVALPYRWH